MRVWQDHTLHHYSVHYAARSDYRHIAKVPSRTFPVLIRNVGSSLASRWKVSFPNAVSSGLEAKLALQTLISQPPASQEQIVGYLKRDHKTAL